jgi:hypothetical protein
VIVGYATELIVQTFDHLVPGTGRDLPNNVENQDRLTVALVADI